jgi:hypothetical protein
MRPTNQINSMQAKRADHGETTPGGGHPATTTNADHKFLTLRTTGTQALVAFKRIITSRYIQRSLRTTNHHAAPRLLSLRSRAHPAIMITQDRLCCPTSHPECNVR